MAKQRKLTAKVIALRLNDVDYHRLEVRAGRRNQNLSECARDLLSKGLMKLEQLQADHDEDTALINAMLEGC